MTKITIAKVLIITTMIFAKETLTAQWSGTSPETTTSDVGVGTTMLGGVPFFTLGAVSNPLGQVHISHLRPASFSPFTPLPKPQLFLESDCETSNQFMSPMRSQYSLEVDCYGGDFKINNHNPNSGSSQNLLSLNSNALTAQVDNFSLKNYFSVNSTQLNLSNILSVSNSSLNFSNGRFNVTNNQSIFNTPLLVYGANRDFAVRGGKILLRNLNGDYLFQVDETGNVRIGLKTATYHPDAKLHVEGKIAAQHFVITKPTNWSDKVFQKGYKLWSLYEIEQFINQNKHLPDVPSEAEVMEKGYDANDMDALLLQKIEELTLHMIELKKENAKLKSQINNLK